MQVLLTQSSPNFCFELSELGGEALQFVQSDWEYPGLASSLGWRPCEHCSYTDGTSPCDHRSVSEMLADAFDWLSEHNGEVFEVTCYD